VLSFVFASGLAPNRRTLSILVPVLHKGFLRSRPIVGKHLANLAVRVAGIIMVDGEQSLCGCFLFVCFCLFYVLRDGWTDLAFVLFMQFYFIHTVN
jgi:hypothetical protein